MKIYKLLVAVAFSALVCLPSVASTIDLGINGDAQVGANFISFSDDFPVDDHFNPASTYGNFVVAEVKPGDMLSEAGLHNGAGGLIQSLDTAIDPVKAPGDFTNVYTPGHAFMNFSNSTTFFLTDLVQGTLAPGSPFTATTTPNGLILTFNVDGYVMNLSTGQRTNYTGTFASTFNGVANIEDLAQQLPLQTPFSATFSLSAVPEPASLFLMGLGLFSASLVAGFRTARG